MNEHPILFSAPMINAILAGRKTMTRRVMKYQPTGAWAKKPLWVDDEAYYHSGKPPKPGEGLGLGTRSDVKCPYGAVGDHLWVRETFCISPKDKGLLYKADMNFDYGHTWKPSIFMPRKASRITLEIKNIRVERLQEITEEDAKREGVPINISDLTIKHFSLKEISNGKLYAAHFAALWDKINGKKHPWSTNPYLWVIEFSLIKRTAK